MTKWTDEQLKAIESTPNLLVSAAAGSGKTAVLVERIIRKLIPDGEGNYVPADRLLIVTFARDAAAEMLERLEAALNRIYHNETKSDKKKILREQLKKLVFSDISTIDSFCIRFVKQNFHLLGIDPKFKIFDEADGKVYTNKCLEEYFDKLYEEHNSNFFLLTSLYAKSYTDRELSELITSVYNFTRSLPDPDFWLDIHASEYASFTESIYSVMIEKNFNQAAKKAARALKKLSEDYAKAVGSFDEETLMSFGSVDLFSVLKSDIKAFESKISFGWDDIFELKNQIAFVKASRSNKADAVLQKEYINCREGILSEIFEIFSMVKSSSSELDTMYSEKLYPHAKAIAELTKGFSEFIYQKKKNDGKFEFNDLEHMTLLLLRNNDDIRNQMVEKYVEILMDEYQDTNALQEEIFNLISNGNNRFMVGDIKQSIYRFRSSDPLIFRSKDELYEKDEQKGKKIVLSRNFRSRQEVLESINRLFERIMSYNVGEVEYNSKQALHYGNRDFDNKCDNNCYTSELYLLEGAQRSDESAEYLSDEETEATFVAKKIRSMIDSRWQVRSENGFRDIIESDFAILMNSVKSDSAVYINALKAQGINGFSDNNEFFERTEIRLMLSFVSAVNNPLKDISLVSVMRSPVYRFTDEELALIRLSSDNEFWNGVITRAETNDKLGIKCNDFVSDINKWRDMSNYMSADRLVWRIMTDCSLYDMCGIMYGGEIALANLRLFLERTRQLSEIGVSTLYDLEQYMNKLSDAGGMSGANLSSKGIPIMTIHKSKGLEFPVVFVCGTGNKFLIDGNRGPVSLHNRLGIGINNIDAELSYSVPTLNRKIIAAEKNRENLSEQLRKFYVALTRTKEKLIVTGVVNATKNTSAFEFADGEVTEKNIQKAGSFIKIIAPAIKQYGQGDWIYNEIEYNSDLPDTSVLTEKSQYDIDMESVKEQVNSTFEKFSQIKAISSVPTKLSVSDLKNGAGIAAKLHKFPSFMIKNENSGAVFGTLVHAVMENININSDMNEDYIFSEIIRITGEENKFVQNMLFEFFNSSLGRRIMLSDEIHREADFEIEIPAINRDNHSLDGETMILQGVVDLYFKENNQYILVDYKTDKCNNLSELADKYSVQLKWYKLAIEKLLNTKVMEVYIYSFHKNDYIELSELIENE